MERLLTAEQVADFLGVPPRTIDLWRYKGIGPKFLKVGKHVRYRRAALEEWVAARERTGTGAHVA